MAAATALDPSSLAASPAAAVGVDSDMVEADEGAQEVGGPASGGPTLEESAARAVEEKASRHASAVASRRNSRRGSAGSVGSLGLGAPLAGAKPRGRPKGKQSNLSQRQRKAAQRAAVEVKGQGSPLTVVGLLKGRRV